MSHTVLVTGAGGFLGRHLITQLAELGTHVCGFDLTPAPGDIPDGLAANITWIQGSILDNPALNAAMQGTRHVYHMAAQAHLGVPQTKQYDLVNHIGTRNVINAARDNDIDHLIITSTEVILRGWRDNTTAPLTEDEPLPHMEDMAGPYCRSKLAAECDARAAIAAGQPISILYPTVPIGEGDVNLTAPAAMIKAFIENPPPAYLDCIFNFVAAEDIARAHILTSEKLPGNRYIIGGHNMEMAALLDIIAPHSAKTIPGRAVPYTFAVIAAHFARAASKISGQAPLASLEGVRLARYKTHIDSSRAKLTLGWEATPIEPVLERAILWLKSQ